MSSNGTRRLMKASALRLRFSQSLASRRQRFQPGDAAAFDHPTPGLDDLKPFTAIGSLDDLDLEIGFRITGQGAVKDRPLIGAVGEQFPEKGKQTETRSPAARDRRTRS